TGERVRMENIDNMIKLFMDHALGKPGEPSTFNLSTVQQLVQIEMTTAKLLKRIKKGRNVFVELDDVGVR
ncbi:hypothetical protein KI387_009354, partial [Taxus chinensis]